MNAIERIEVLPTTASGIYGGSATGGVVNVVLRRDYRGVETSLSYENTVREDVRARRADVSGEFNFGQGRTSLQFTASYSDAGPLFLGDRDFYYDNGAPSATTGLQTIPTTTRRSLRRRSGRPPISVARRARR